ncbi:DHA2 family efflux MFS transporter permease subunit [Heliobacterium gestii]|uniref:DHA2 family efflux MFS transporter permease subunit n=2 Tax=Heliomicrobium gestii TaxID=2699 RepID=A0A845LBI6_HELGE|nr:DHA2 family efflux MFS transporter permease subunit [Heliomicrobium gestii]
MAASVMGPIDGSVVNVALPTFSQVFQVGLHTVSWVTMAYLLVLGSLILTYGRLGDIYGFKRILLLGIALFTAASALCALAPTIWVLVAFRALQAIGAGMFMAVGPAIIASVFPPQERGRALGTNGMVVAVGLALGPTLGGFLLTWAGWKAIFLINIPVGLLGFLLCLRMVPARQDTRPQSFDLAGAALGFFTLGAVLLAGSYGEEWGWTSPVIVALLALFAVGAAAFVAWERRVEQPMLDLGLFKNRVFLSANFAGLMNFMALSSMMFLLPFFMQQVLRMDAGRIGMVLTVSPALMLVMSPLSGTLSDKFGTRRLAFAGQSLVAVSLFLMAGLRPEAQAVDVIWRLSIFGLGAGIFQAPNNSAVMGSVPRHRLGIGSGVLATVRNVGMVLGIAVSSALVTWQAGVHAAPGAVDGTAGFMAGLRTAFLAGSLLAASGAVASLARGELEGAGEKAAEKGPKR